MNKLKLLIFGFLFLFFINSVSALWYYQENANLITSTGSWTTVSNTYDGNWETQIFVKYKNI